MKTKLTKDDPSGWYECDDKFGMRRPRWWDGKVLKMAIDDVPCCELYTNFRRLIEHCEPELIEGDGIAKLSLGIYWRQANNSNVEIVNIERSSTALKDCRYIRIPDPVFPAREEPDPPQPKLVLASINGGAREWVISHGTHYSRINGATFGTADVVEAKGAKA